MFKKVLIANRGEIAIRVIRCLRELGIQSVVVYSDADRESLAVRWANQAVHLPGVASADTYMDIDKVIAAAKKTGAEAIHPGYGFLSENANFARRCVEEGLVFIGPNPESITKMGDKTTARDIMIARGVPVTPGFQEEGATPEQVFEAAKKIGFPVMIKASAGGGGKGMRLVRDPEQFTSSFEMARSEAINAFGDGRIYVEKFIVNPRHIEVQIVCDKHGNMVHFHERECSIQRRHQKVIEEAPSPVVDPESRARVGDIALRAAEAAGYDSIGTVEFLMDKDKNFYFMEMNTRLQVEHPVTEMITGRDLVQIQIDIAAGKPLDFKQEDIALHGHSVECRIYAEDPSKNFMPSPGKIIGLTTPNGMGVRDDSGVYQGYEVPIHYDPMISKLATWGATRQEAINRMSRALGEYKISGIETNLWFHRRLMHHKAFVEGDMDTGFIEKHPELLVKNPGEQTNPDMALVAAAIKYYKDQVGKSVEGSENETESTNGWKAYARRSMVGY